MEPNAKLILASLGLTPAAPELAFDFPLSKVSVAIVETLPPPLATTGVLDPVVLDVTAVTKCKDASRVTGADEVDE